MGKQRFYPYLIGQFTNNFSNSKILAFDWILSKEVNFAEMEEEVIRRRKNYSKFSQNFSFLLTIVNLLSLTTFLSSPSNV
jgi:hypothetical protein